MAVDPLTDVDVLSAFSPLVFATIDAMLGIFVQADFVYISFDSLADGIDR